MSTSPSQGPTSDAYSAHYLLPDNLSDSDRLNLQHRLLVHAMSDHLWGSAPPNLDQLEGANVLDSGTGTGVWLEDLQKRIKKADITPSGLYGIDVSDGQFPTSLDQDDRRQFKVANVIDLPEEWTGKFFLVHQRLLILALTEEEWHKCIGECFRILKTGGYVTFIERDYPYTSSNSPSDRLTLMARKLLTLKGMMHNICSALPKMLEQAGFVDVIVNTFDMDVCASRGKIGQQGADITLDALRKVGPACVKAGVIADQQELDDLIQELREEWDREKKWRPFQSFTARKP